MHEMKIIRPLQISFNHRVMEQNRKFYFVASACMAFPMGKGDPLLDVDYLKDAFSQMGEFPLPDPGMPKPKGEFLVSGSFHAPDKTPVTQGNVRVRVENREKELLVSGKRVWKNGFPSTPEPVLSVPVDFAHAFGGKDYPQNPIGMGYQDGNLPLVEDPKHPVTSPGATPEPASFSPEDPGCPARRKFAGTYGADYMQKYFPGYPKDMDWRLFLMAQEDQWMKGYFQGGEEYEMENMHPEEPLVGGRIPGFLVRCFLEYRKKNEKKFSELPLDRDTLWFFPEKKLVLVYFRGVTQVEDDEAEEIETVLLAYEDPENQMRDHGYYRQALQKRQTSEDPLLHSLVTRDLIPAGHKCAMEILTGKALAGGEESRFEENLDAAVASMEKDVDEKILDAGKEMKNAENRIAKAREEQEFSADIPDMKAKMDETLASMKQGAELQDPDVQELYDRMEKILPGITKGDPKQLDFKDFSFEKISALTALTTEFTEKKEQESLDMLRPKLEQVKQKIEQQIEQMQAKGPEIDDAHMARLEEAKKSLDSIDPHHDTLPEAPLPRMKAEELQTRMAQVSPAVMQSLSHIKKAKEAGMETQELLEAEKTALEQLEAANLQMEEAATEAEKGFRDSYILSAHFLENGLSPHDEPLETVRERFLQRIADGEDISFRDWACLDLRGVDLSGVNLAGCYLEQVDFTGAVLTEADLSGAILARAILTDADFSGTNLKEANIGGVVAHNTSFCGSDLTKAKLSRGDFTKADFSNARLEEIENMEVLINHARFAGAFISGLMLFETRIQGVDFAGATIEQSFFYDARIEGVNFSKAKLSRVVFADVIIENGFFHDAVMESVCFAKTDPEKSSMEKTEFQGADLSQCCFMGMDLASCDFENATLENANFISSNLSHASLKNVYARNAMFRKADLTRANLKNSDLMQAGFSKARIVGASFAGANLYCADFLRAIFGNTDFTGANLDNTLIRDWRPD